MKKIKKKAWGGRFAKASHPLLEAFNASINFDRRLYAQDIQGSLAHALMLKKIGVLTDAECGKIQKGLKQILAEIENGKFKWKIENEDVHMAIEARLTAMIGPLGGKLHTGRSRNDQVALDLRLYCREKMMTLVEELSQLQQAIIVQAEQNPLIPMPGYTHLQRAQPIYWAHHWLAYCEMFQRDKERLKDALKRVNISPLGSGALAGSTFALDRDFVAKQLNMDGVTQNSLDGVSDRDFVAEFLFIMSLVMTHLSRLAEELILWSTLEFGFVKLPQEFCTGSSMMPQKINPDIPELVRGKTGRVYGNLMGLLTVMKGLPLAYNKDMQEDKEGLFDSIDTVETCVSVMAAMIPHIQANEDILERATKEGFLLATDVADYLVDKKVPFRDAHEVSGQLVQYCIKNGKVLEDLNLEEMKKFSSKIEADIQKWLDVRVCINKRDLIGGPAKSRVMKRLAHYKKMLG